MSTHIVRDTIGQSCIEVNKSKKTVFIWGDSHAQAIAQGIKTNNNYNYIQVASSGCKADIDQNINADNLGIKADACTKSNNHALFLIKKHKPEIVIIAQQDEHELTDFNLLSKQLNNYDVQHIIVIGPTPQWEKGLPKIIAAKYFNVEDKLIPSDTIKESILNTHSIMKTKTKKYVYISLIDFLCEQDKCLMKVDNLNTPLIFDYGHLTYEGALYLHEEYLFNYLNKY
jgi:hypothetical protein